VADITKQQILIGVAVFVITGILSTLGAGVLSLLNKVEANETRVQAIELALPSPESQKEINIELSTLLTSIQGDLDDIVITDGQTSMSQGLLLNSIQMDIVRIKTKLGID